MGSLLSATLQVKQLARDRQRHAPQIKRMEKMYEQYFEVSFYKNGEQDYTAEAFLKKCKELLADIEEQTPLSEAAKTRALAVSHPLFAVCENSNAQMRITATSDPWTWEVELEIESIELFHLNRLHLILPVLSADALVIEPDHSEHHAAHIHTPFLYVGFSINLENQKKQPTEE